MNLQQLKRTAVKEFKRSPAKSCTLLAMLPVAAYFILPLVWQPIARPTAQQGTASSAANFLAPAAVAVQSPATTAGSVTWDWRELARRIGGDERMATASPTESSRNPFAPPTALVTAETTPVEATAVGEEQAAAQDQAESDADPASVLRLTSVILGDSERMAAINGVLVAEGSQLSVRGLFGGESPKTFRLVKVGKHGVVLEDERRQYSLRLQPAHRLDPGDYIQIRLGQ